MGLWLSLKLTPTIIATIVDMVDTAVVYTAIVVSDTAMAATDTVGSTVDTVDTVYMEDTARGALKPSPTSVCMVWATTVCTVWATTVCTVGATMAAMPASPPPPLSISLAWPPPLSLSMPGSMLEPAAISPGQATLCMLPRGKPRLRLRLIPTISGDTMVDSMVDTEATVVSMVDTEATADTGTVDSDTDITTVKR